jgi:hypothetical protein
MPAGSGKAGFHAEVAIVRTSVAETVRGETAAIRSPLVAPSPRSRHLRRVRSPAMGIFLIGVWLGTFLGIVVAALLRAAAEHDLTG